MEPESSLTAFTSARHLSLSCASSGQSVLLLFGTVNYLTHINTKIYLFVNKFCLKMAVIGRNMWQKYYETASYS